MVLDRPGREGKKLPSPLRDREGGRPSVPFPLGHLELNTASSPTGNTGFSETGPLNGLNFVD